MANKKNLFIVLLIFIFISSAKCSSYQNFKTAIVDAAVVEANEKKPLSIINEESVKVVTFTEYLSSYPKGQEITICWPPVWVTLLSEMQEACKEFPKKNLDHRIIQYLGMRPDSKRKEICNTRS